MSEVKGHGATRPRSDISVPLIKALNHPLRREILRQFDRGEEWSPNQLSKVITPRFVLSNITHHVRVLAKFNAVRLVGTKRVRGAEEHLYVSHVADNSQVIAILEATEDEDRQLLSEL